MPINEYLKRVNTLYKNGKATEHSYRGDLQKLIEHLVQGISATNEPKRIECGAPDYILERKKIPVGYIEAKDIGVELNSTEKSEQLERYKKSLDNLILTDYLEFRIFKYGQKVTTIKIAEIEKGRVVPIADNFASFRTHLTDFCSFSGQTIKSAEKLAKLMAQKARMMEEVIFKAVTTEDEDNTLKEQLEAFQKILIHDLSEKDFADIYAQTISYGLFAARLHDETLEDFSREEALFLVPKSNPFLRNLFTYIAGPDLDIRVIWIVNDLADIFRATDINALLSDFGKVTQQTDPFIHFYETFLAEYDPKLRKSRGVYYTPEPVVNFIVRAVDDILKTEFNLPQGLADTSKIEIKTEEPGHNKKIKKKIHKVQILDPATGTGTFLAEIVKQIYKKFENQKGIWSSYVENELLPRLNGFEILMAPYTMCHLKLEVLLRRTGYKAKNESKQQRLRVFLTNSLEEAHPYSGTLFASWLSKEATEANYVKNETPVMVILGNPPYSVSSSNKGEWISNLIEDYKKNLNEANKNSLSDDYVKFIRYGENFIENSNDGILAFISNNSFIDGIIHRNMRSHLLKTFSKIFIVDLHGNSLRKETSVDGSKDQNVFDIQQGVSINIFFKNNNSSKMGSVYHFDLFGERTYKYDFLSKNSLNSIKFRKLNAKSPYYFFVPKNFKREQEYNKYTSINEIFKIYGSGIKFRKDNLLVKNHHNKEDVIEMINSVINLSNKEVLKKYNTNETDDWKLDEMRKYFQKYEEKDLVRVQYRPFDDRYSFYPLDKISKIIPRGDSRLKLMKNFINKDNFGLVCVRQFAEGLAFNHVFINKNIVEGRMTLSNKGMCYSFPLYIYSENSDQNTLLDISTRESNLSAKFLHGLEEKLQISYNQEGENNRGVFTSEGILSYIYAVLYSPLYRERYKEFLKIDFPRIPYPEDKKSFWKLAKLGGELRQIHLLESPVVEKFKTSYPIEGDNIVAKIKFEGDKKGRVWINDSQYFDKVPEISWGFYIGGYQPAQKWLKDRKGRALSFEDISHYQKIIVALFETDRIMKSIDKVIKF